MEGAEWVCEEEDSERHIAIIIMTAKEAGPGDTLDEYYLIILRKTKTPSTDGDRPFAAVSVSAVSNETGSTDKNLDRLPEQFESELPNYDRSATSRDRERRRGRRS